jgi:hypothetical protein
MLVEIHLYIVLLNGHFCQCRIAYSLGKLIAEVNEMSIIKQSIKNGFDSKKVTLGDPQDVPNRISSQEQNIQTKPARPK